MINAAPVLIRYVIIRIISYLLGSLSFSIIISRIAFKDDIRNYGSGNAGMTNVLRTFGRSAAVFTFIGDFLKGLVSVFIARAVMSGGVFASAVLPDKLEFFLRTGLYIAAAGALAGHLKPVFFDFKGGKGVSVTFGALIAINPIQVFIAAAVFGLTVLFSRIVSLASILAAASYALITIAMYYISGNVLLPDIIAAIIFPGVIIYAHRSNIKRLLNGTEYKFGQKK